MNGFEIQRSVSEKTHWAQSLTLHQHRSHFSSVDSAGSGKKQIAGG